MYRGYIHIYIYVYIDTHMYICTYISIHVSILSLSHRRGPEQRGDDAEEGARPRRESIPIRSLSIAVLKQDPVPSRFLFELTLKEYSVWGSTFFSFFFPADSATFLGSPLGTKTYRSRTCVKTQEHQSICQSVFCLIYE